uniref:Uncharacterized protein n=1 Tax=Mesocestoides corti TaxID=53468 RepID=A0A5K3G855_MESCO
QTLAGRGGARLSSSTVEARWRKPSWSPTIVLLTATRKPCLKTSMVVCSVSTVVKCASSVGSRS